MKLFPWLAIGWLTRLLCTGIVSVFLQAREIIAGQNENGRPEPPVSNKTAA